MSGEPDRELVDRELPDPFPSAGKASGKKRVSSIFTSPALSSSEPDPATARSVMVGHRCSSTLGLPFSLKSSTSRRTHSECDPSVEALSAKRAEVSVSVLHERSLPLQVSTKLLTGRVRVGMAGGGRDRGPPSEGAAAEGPPLPSPPPPPQASGDLVRGGGVEGGSAAGEDAAAGPTEVPSAKPESFPDIAPGGPSPAGGSNVNRKNGQFKFVSRGKDRRATFDDVGDHNVTTKTILGARWDAPGNLKPFGIHDCVIQANEAGDSEWELSLST
ncbi:hypothetical protein EMIHUDRAFT_221074 [Emiliania huxleyi CCMP1516]|uniref:Uncharacterized protein n=2 Tax=Emiliania huxleyi TaxID=2903 RepID=A0A0D3HZY1_EMIH1|nr:hypothetical protein EMIHUDRAFT_221074 [Emiliania huxleyi CCMP1516]EOD04566.1 hypothetical protein EMIHUDRAFT_221074 [Emiliania huxleyi CCMP1516]|eukprot:XP_005756995.1 hypothetical protein EMIHUDRAFT_221074 [Emiliania huxleyi CCMP1516]